LPILGQKPDYNVTSIAVTLYYSFWVGIAVIAFWPAYSNWRKFENPVTSSIVWPVSVVGCIFFAAYILPLLPPPPVWTGHWPAPEIRVATSWYFLPKSIEILFQQLLVLSLVLVLSTHHYSMRRISVYCALAFGATHVLLVLDGVPPGYVIRFMIAATAFGFAFPYLILRVPNGLAYAYIVHWLYYAATVAMPRILSSSAT
jgi:hypothetical protein